MLVRQELHLDVSWAFEVALEEDGLVSEACFRLAACGVQSLVELVGRANDTHSAPASAGRGLDEERESDFLGAGRRGEREHRPRTAARFASSLSPAARRTSWGGPTQVSPAPSTAAAKLALSARKP